jgi:predicted aspartyl protease
MKKLNKFTKSSTSTSVHNIGDSEDFEQKLSDLLRKSLDITLSFSGREDESPEDFLRQFVRLEDEWSSDRLLKNIKTNLRGEALDWFCAYEKKMDSYDSFLNLFKKEYVIEEEEDDEKLFWITVHEGPTDNNMLSFVYRLMRFAGEKENRFLSAREAVVSVAPRELQREFKKVSTWLELVDLIKEEKEFISKVLKTRSDKNKNYKFQQKENQKSKEESVSVKESQSFKVESRAEKSEDSVCLAIKEVTSIDTDDIRPRVLLSSKRLSFNALIDTGATISVISRKMAKKLKLKEKLTRTKINMVSGTVDSCGTVSISVDEGNGNLKKIDLCLADDMREDLILGMPEITKLNLLKFIKPIKENKNSKSQEVVASCEIKQDAHDLVTQEENLALKNNPLTRVEDAMDGWKASESISTKAETEIHQGSTEKGHAEELVFPANKSKHSKMRGGVSPVATTKIKPQNVLNVDRRCRPYLSSKSFFVGRERKHESCMIKTVDIKDKVRLNILNSKIRFSWFKVLYSKILLPLEHGSRALEYAVP